MQHLRRCSLILHFLFFSFQFSHARTVTFPVHGLEVAASEAVSIDCEWDEKWFYECKTTDYNHNIARIAALFAEISYVAVEKNPESNELMQSYRALGFKDNSVECNYLLDYTTPITGNNQAAYSFAHKDIQTPNGTKKLVFVVLRGTPLSANEWISNINVSDTTHKDVLIHEGFYNTTANVHTALIYYLLKNKISPEESIFLITGHSRGAALANLLAATLEDEGIITGERLFVYTFAAPNVTQDEKASDEKYNFIWNIVNAEDIVPTVPPNRNNWKWRKFGHTKVLVNYWNTAQKVYLDDYLPRMNEYFRRFLLRDYAPFKTGPFLHIQVARILTNFYKNVESYYRSVFGLRNMAENIFWKIFPEETDEKAPLPPDEEQKMPALLRMIQRNVNANIEGGFEYALNAFVDMHACESYLSWMLALDEDEIFSEVGNSQIVINGNYDCAIYDDDGNLLGRILDGSVELYSLKVPVAAMPLPRKNVIGVPGNQNLSVIIYKNSLLPTIIPYEIEHYDAAGALLGESKKQYLYPHVGNVIRFSAGEVTIHADTINYEKIKGKEARSLVKQYGLNHDVKFRIQPELGYTSDKIFTAGFRTGSQAIFGNILGSFSVKNPGKAFALSLGIGHQQSLYGRILLDIEAFNKFVWSRDDVEGREFNLVPMGRFTISLKPRHRLHFFAGGLFELRIKDFNDGAFDILNRDQHIHGAKIAGKAEIVPSFAFGIRF